MSAASSAPQTTPVMSLRLLYDLLLNRETDLDVQLEKALELVSSFLGLDVGIISRIQGDTYTVKSVYAPGSGMEPGTVFDLGTTYCNLVLAADDVVSIDDVKTSRYEGHPCYHSFGLESYIGAPVIVSGERFGTINFSSPQPRQHPFSEADREFVRLLAEWTGVTLEREAATLALQQSEALLRNVIDSTLVGVIVLGAVRDKGRVKDFVIDKANDVTAAILRRSKTQVIGERLLTLSPEFAKSELLEHYLQVIETGRPYSGDIFMPADTTPFGHEAWYALTAVKLGDGLVVTYTDITQQKDNERQLEVLAYRDDLTGLANRRAFFAAAEQQQALAKRKGWSIALLFVDLNGFKGVNDTLGHEAGDQLIREVAGRLRSVTRSEEAFARMGGDEFALFLLDTDGAGARRVAERIISTLSEPFTLAGTTVNIGASIGIANGAANLELDTLLHRADQAMYRAKQGKQKGRSSLSVSETAAAR